jgi:hypothetical protein
VSAAAAIGEVDGIGTLVDGIAEVDGIGTLGTLPIEHWVLHQPPKGPTSAGWQPSVSTQK